MITIFNRRELTITWDQARQAEIRSILSSNGIESTVKLVDFHGSSRLYSFYRLSLNPVVPSARKHPVFAGNPSTGYALCPHPSWDTGFKGHRTQDFCVPHFHEHR